MTEIEMTPLSPAAFVLSACFLPSQNSMIHRWMKGRIKGPRTRR